MITLATAARKTALLAIAGMIALSVFALSGCAAAHPGGNDDRRIAELEREVEELKKQNEAAKSSGSVDSSSKDSAAKNDAQSAAASDATVADLSTRADDLIAQAEAVQPEGDRNARASTYLEFERQFEALDREIDQYDDQKEADYRNNSLSQDEYRAIERQLDDIKDKLNAAEDALELRLGVDK